MIGDDQYKAGITNQRNQISLSALVQAHQQQHAARRLLFDGEFLQMAGGPGFFARANGPPAGLRVRRYAYGFFDLEDNTVTGQPANPYTASRLWTKPASLWFIEAVPVGGGAAGGWARGYAGMGEAAGAGGGGG